MFLEAFGLARDPFVDTADPAFYYDTLPGAHARRRLADALARGRGLAVVVGPIGAGKTSLFNAVAHDMLASDRFAVASILDPTFADESEVLVAIADAFGFAVDVSSPPRGIKDSIKRALFDASSRGVQPVLFIDEAQLLPPALLEPLRALLNFQLDDRKLLSIALSGQMELASTIAATPNVSDRVALWIELGPLSPPEAAGLLHHRLRCAGFSGGQSPFEDEALHELWQHSHGLPRRLTALARESMEIAAEYARPRVRASDVRDALARVAPAHRAQREAARSGSSTSHDAPRPWWQWWRRAS